MIYLNTNGQKKKVVKATIQMEVEFVVGGEDDADRMDSVQELFNDHYDEIADNAFLKDGITSMFIDNLEVVGNEE